jgi:rubrerythrin
MAAMGNKEKEVVWSALTKMRLLMSDGDLGSAIYEYWREQGIDSPPPVPRYRDSPAQVSRFVYRCLLCGRDVHGNEEGEVCPWCGPGGENG